MKKLRGRLLLDLLLTVMLVFEMFFQLTGDFLHEVIGVAFFVTVVVHLALAHKWMGVTARSIREGKRLKAGNKLRMVVGILLGIDMLVLMASSVAVSNLLLNAGVDLAANMYGTWATVHTASAYILASLVVGHLLIHWASVAAAFKIPYNPQRRAAINTGVAAVVAVSTVAVGSTGLNRVMEMAGAEPVGDSASNSNESSGAYGSSEGSGTSDGSDSTQAPFGSDDGTAYADTLDDYHGHRHGGRRFNDEGENGGYRNGYGQDDGSGSQGSSDQNDSGDFWSGSKQNGGTGSGSSSNSSPNSGSGSGSSSNSNSGSSSSSNSSSGSGSSSNPGSSSGSASGICTLCRKNCPLSAPKCNRPYTAGLL